MPRSAILLSTDQSGAIPEPPPMQMISLFDFSRSMKTPYGPFTTSSWPTLIPPSSRLEHQRPPGIHDQGLPRWSVFEPAGGRYQCWPGTGGEGAVRRLHAAREVEQRHCLHRWWLWNGTDLVAAQQYGRTRHRAQSHLLLRSQNTEGSVLPGPSATVGRALTWLPLCASPVNGYAGG